MKLFAALILAIALAFSFGARIHFDKISPKTIGKVGDWFTMNEKDNFWIQKGLMKKKKKAPAVRPGTDAWGKREKNYATASSASSSGYSLDANKSGSTSGYTLDKAKEGERKPPPKGSMMDLIQKTMSKESIDKWGEQMQEDMRNRPQNPLMETFKYGAQPKEESQ